MRTTRYRYRTSTEMNSVHRFQSWRLGMGNDWVGRVFFSYRHADRSLLGGTIKNRLLAVDFGRRWPIEGEIDRRWSIEREIDCRRSIEGEKGKKKKKKRKRRKKEEKEKKNLLSTRHNLDTSVRIEEESQHYRFAILRLASDDMIDAKIEAIETHMEDKLRALFEEFRLGRSRSPKRSQRKNSDHKENPAEEGDQASNSCPCMRVDFPR
ncbi:hypothetical protein BHM03_00022699 [Ensete ventricosum]|nr:hypothetical protein BHM03_00022699 [Ensete ventricosum]